MRARTVLLFCLPAVAHAQACKEVPTIAPSFDVSLLRPGTYRLILVSTSGRKEGATAKGELHLRATSATDRSPTTGKVAEDSNLAEAPLYGWSDLNFRAVDASVANASSGDPAPSSRDPVYPGVLVSLRSFKEGYPQDTPVLLIGTVSNRRASASEIAIDGGGIGLWLRRLDKNTFAGEWSRWGIAMSGSGYFCAARVGP